MHRLLSVDWGTSNFRIRLVDTISGEVIAEHVTDDGIAAVHHAWKSAGADRSVFYTSILSQNIAALRSTISETLIGLPLMISGMASSTLGIEELPYATLPFNADGSSVRFKSLEVDGFNHPAWLLSGLRSDNDVIRGEETQWIGLMQDQEQHINKLKDLVFILPGTHSKHITVRSGLITDFKTYMTGEFFSLLSNFSVLKNSVLVQDAILTESDEQAFVEGVHAAAKVNLLHESFMVRTNDLFERFNHKQNAAFLSGLLIGTELMQVSGATIVLAAGAALSKRYALAFRHIGAKGDLIICPPGTLERSVVMGQLTIFKKITKA